MAVCRPRYRVRFAAPVSLSAAEAAPDATSKPTICETAIWSASPQQDNDRPRGHRSRLGCRNCKKRRVKCDEAFPVCRRCQKRGEVCESITRDRPWQPETPWLLNNTRLLHRMEPGNASDTKLLRYWLEKASQIMALDPDNNPMSFPILELFNKSPSLIHALQSVSAAHQNFFSPDGLEICLEERTLAMGHVRKELDSGDRDMSIPFLTVFLLGLSSFWTAGPSDDPATLQQAEAHFHGGRALIDGMLALPPADMTQQMYFAVGAYVYWDMACSFLIPSEKQRPLNTAAVFAAVQVLGNTYHPILGYSTEITYLLANLGRYCRWVFDTGQRDTVLEATFEEQLLQWEPNRDSPELGVLGDAYRHCGLINLYTACLRPAPATTKETPIPVPRKTTPVHVDAVMDIDLSGLDMGEVPDLSECDVFDCDIFDPGETDDFWNDDTFNTLFTLEYEPLAYPSDPESDSEGTHSDSGGESNESSPGMQVVDVDKTVHDLALQTVMALTKISESHPFTNLHGIPLLTAGSELTSEDETAREVVRKRFRALYSLNHLPANLAAVDLLEEVWTRRDEGIVTSWLSVMLEKGWYLMLG